jgi:hypothetical protein
MEETFQYKPEVFLIQDDQAGTYIKSPIVRRKDAKLLIEVRRYGISAPCSYTLYLRIENERCNPHPKLDSAWSHPSFSA